MNPTAPARAPSDGELALIAALERTPVRGSARARDMLRAQGLPTRRQEAWRWSDLRAAVGADLPLPAPDASTDEAFRDRAVFAPTDDVIAELAIAFGRERRVRVPAGESMLLLEELDGPDVLDLRYSVIEVAAGASLTRIVSQSGGGVRLSSANVRVESGGRFRQLVIAQGARLTRLETRVSLEGEGAEVSLHGAYLCDAGRHADLTSIVTHKAANSRTVQLVKGVARRGGRGVFQGKIVVERAAQKTDARQHHQGMLLEEGAEIFAKPELMIHADDVACAHGNTAGGLDEKALFYMRSRGVPETEARALLTEAFLLEALPDWAPPHVREAIEARIATWLRGAS